MNAKKYMSVFWNTIGSGLMSAQAAIILIFVARAADIETAGVISIAYALGSLFFCLARYGVKNYQATDVKEEFSFGTYVSVRAVTVIVSLAAALIYLSAKLFVHTYDMSKTLLILEIVALKLVDASEDVFSGRLQQTGNFIVGARIMAIRLMVVTAAISAAVMLGLSVHTAFLIGIILSITLSSVLLYGKRSIWNRNNGINKGIARDRIWQLMKNCFPLCIATTIAIYVGNIPKYMIDIYMDEKTQAIFGYIMLPVFVVTMLNQFIYLPFVKELGDLWAGRDIRQLKKRVFRQCIIIFAIAAAVLLGFLIVGLPLLSLLYNVDLSPYKQEFMILLCGGTLYSMAYYLTVPLTTIRRQNYIAAAYIAISVLCAAAGGVFVKTYGMMGAAILYLIINLLLMLVFVFLFNRFAVAEPEKENN